MSNLFKSKKQVKSVNQPPNFGRLLCRSKFESQHKNHQVKNSEKNCVSCLCLLQASLCKFKQINKTFLLTNSFNCESSNLIYVVICQECKEEYIGETRCVVKERINIYRKHIRQPKCQQLAVEEHLRTYVDGRFHMFPFSKVIQEYASLRKSYEDYFIDKFKPLLNK